MTKQRTRLYIVKQDGSQYLGMLNREPVFCDDGSMYLNESQAVADCVRVAKQMDDNSIRVVSI